MFWYFSRMGFLIDFGSFSQWLYENNSSGSSLMFSFPSILRMKNWSIPKSAKIGWTSSFCEGSTVFCLTKQYPGLIWLSRVSIAHWTCGSFCICFAWSSCSFWFLVERPNISTTEIFFNLVWKVTRFWTSVKSICARSKPGERFFSW